MKTIEQINNTKNKWYSLECFPPRSEHGLLKIIEGIDKLTSDSLLYVDITWGAGGGNPCLNTTGSLATAKNVLTYCDTNVMIHLTYGSYTDEELFVILDKIKDSGIKNILALRGDKVEYNNRYAENLIRKIREHSGNYFGITVAGYPQMHPDSKNKEEDLMFLKRKVDAGADTIITQLFFDSKVYIDFLHDCRKIGITIPIIPGILPIQSYKSLSHIVKLSKLEVPKAIQDDINKIKNDDVAIRNYGIEKAVELAKICLQYSDGIHFYCLNRFIALKEILTRIDLLKNNIKQLPWKSTIISRQNEKIRPIFWGNQPDHYITHTQEWNDFPNGRWGDFQNPGFGEPDSCYIFKTNVWLEKERYQWTIPLKTIDSVAEIFYNFLDNKISGLPWCLENVQDETIGIKSHLIQLNKKYIFTINSQPPLNSIKSNHPVHGWGSKGGYVYQKGYLECFVPTKIVETLKSIDGIYYYSQDNNGKIITTDKDITTIGLTWGVFENAEILQPTIFNINSFNIWRKEAFNFWKTRWQNYYTKDSESWQIIQEIIDNYSLLVIVDNNYLDFSFDRLMNVFPS